MPVFGVHSLCKGFSRSRAWDLFQIKDLSLQCLVIIAVERWSLSFPCVGFLQRIYDLAPKQVLKGYYAVKRVVLLVSSTQYYKRFVGNSRTPLIR